MYYLLQLLLRCHWGIHQDKDGYQYECTVSGCNTSVASPPWNQTIHRLPYLTLQPANNELCAGNQANFVLKAGGYGTLSYQWLENGTPISTNVTSSNYANYTGQTTDSLTINDVTGMNGNQYLCVISGSCPPPTTSSLAYLYVNNGPSITVQPQNISGCPNSSVNVSVTASSTAPLTYQWYYNGNAINNSSATSSVYTVTNLSTLNTGTYSCQVSDNCNTVVSGNASVTLNNFGIQNSPSWTLTHQGGVVHFNVTATGSNVNYQWQVSTNQNCTTQSCFTNITNGNLTLPNNDVVTYSNATTNTLVITSVDTTMNKWVYACLVTDNICGTIIQSDTASLYVKSRGTPGLWTGFQDNNWNNIYNWDTQTLPNSGTNVSIFSSAGNQPVIRTHNTGNCANLTINPQASVTVDSLGTLQAEGSISILSDNTGTGAFLDEHDATVNITGNVTIQRYIPHLGYNYISTPVHGAKWNVLKSFNNSIAKDTLIKQNFKGQYYNPLKPPTSTTASTAWWIDESHTHPNDATYGWKAPLSLADTLMSMRGYAVNFWYNKITIYVTGSASNLNSDNKRLYKLHLTHDSSGVALAGNPFQAPLNWYMEANDPSYSGSIQSGITFYYPTSQYLGGWGYYSPALDEGDSLNSDGSLTGGTGAYPHGRYIPAFQGFYTQAEGHGGNITFKNDYLTVDPNAMGQIFYKKDYNDMPGKYPLLKLQAYLTDNNTAYKDELTLYFADNSTEQYDTRFDNRKYMNNEIEWPNLYSRLIMIILQSSRIRH